MANYDKYIYSTGTRYISNCGSNEYGTTTGGQKGDQTGNEWVLKAWYSRPWDCVLRYPDQSVALKFAELACAAALNDNIGYDQTYRDSFWDELQKVNYDPAKITTPCSADCSSGVIAIVKAVGYLMGIKALQNISATYTGNMKSAFKSAGFEVLTASKYTSGSEYLLPGDVNLNESKHTAFSVTVGSKATFNPGTTDSGTTSGTTSGTKTVDELAQEIIAEKWGDEPDRTKNLKAAGYDDATIEAAQAKVNELLGASGSSGSGTTTSNLPSYTVGSTYTTRVNGLTVRTGAGTSYAAKSYSELTANAQANANASGTLKKGTRVTCQKTKVVGSDVWMQIPSGWIAAYYEGQYYVS